MSLARSPQAMFSGSNKEYHNLQILNECTLKSFSDSIKPYAEILKGLQEKGYFTDKQVPEYVPELPGVTKMSNLHLTSIGLAAAELPETVKLSNGANFPAALAEKMNLYIDIIIDAFDSKLAQKSYEKGVPERENISERDHGLQAGKTALLLGMQSSEVLAMLFHDIARVTIDGEEYGHANHHIEGDTILTPLDLELSFTYYHGFAKYLLNEFCPEYEKLLSPISRASLKVQKKSLQPQIEALNKLTDEGLAEFIQKMMLLRLIDDLSKAPQLSVEEVLKLQGRTIEYFSNDDIRHRLQRQFQMRLSSENFSAAEMNGKLDAAMALLVRSREFSNNPALYEKYDEVCNSRSCCTIS